jgi:hypothetical protein
MKFNMSQLQGNHGFHSKPADAVKILGQYFSHKEIEIINENLGALSKQDLVQKLVDPPKKFKPSTTMNRTGGMTTLKLTYQNAPQF